jgi:hypothetical protein
VSTRAEVWKDPFAEPSHTYAPAEPNLEHLTRPEDLADRQDPIRSLVRQLFTPASSTGYKKILFVSPGAETEITSFCEHVAAVMAETLRVRVGIVDPSVAEAEPCGKKQALGQKRPAPPLPGMRPEEQVWRIPCPFTPDNRAPVSHVAITQLGIDCLVLGAMVGDALIPLFCRMCDTAVLVVTANRTRKDSALRAKQLLQQYGIALAGIVLTERIFPIPESIYQRL